MQVWLVEEVDQVVQCKTWSIDTGKGAKLRTQTGDALSYPKKALDTILGDRETLVLPLYWPHAALGLGGSKAAFAEELPKDLESVGLDVRAAQREGCPLCNHADLDLAAHTAAEHMKGGASASEPLPRAISGKFLFFLI